MRTHEEEGVLLEDKEEGGIVPKETAFFDKTINLHPWHLVESIGVVVQRQYGLQRNTRL